MSRRITLILLALLLAGASAALTARDALAVEGFRRSYKVKRGDTLGHIARRFKLKIRDIKRWNRLRSSRIRVGQKLTLYTLEPQRPTRIVDHKIRRGDTLIKIAKKYGTTVKKLRRLNRLRRGRYLIAGRTLKVAVPGPKNPSKSKGRPQYGKLINGERLPKGPGYTILDRNKAWGANHVITLLMRTIPKVKKKWRRAPNVVVGDLSLKNGGKFRPHRSHQNGLDVDIGYYHKLKPHPDKFKSATAKTLDVQKTWYLIKKLIDTGQVDYIFVDYKLQKVMYEYARKRGARKKWLRKVFQYPRSRGNMEGIIRHSRSHHHHFHVRFKPRPKPGES